MFWGLADDTENIPDNPPKADWKWQGGDTKPGVVAYRSEGRGPRVWYGYKSKSV